MASVSGFPSVEEQNRLTAGLYESGLAARQGVPDTPTSTTMPVPGTAPTAPGGLLDDSPYSPYTPQPGGLDGSWSEGPYTRPYSDPANRAYDIRSGTAYVTPESLVSTQLQTLLAGDSPYIQAARTRAAEQVGSRGLLNTSIAAGAGERAAIESALPIAAQNATVFAQANLTQQQAENLRQQTYTEGAVSGDLKVLQTQLDQSTQAIQNSFTEAMKRVDFENTVYLTDMQQTWDRDTRVKLQDMSDTLQMRLQSNDISQAQYDSSMSAMSQISQNTQTAIGQLLASDDFMAGDIGYEEREGYQPGDLPPSVVTFNNLLAHSNASMDLVGSMGNIDQARLNVILENYKNAASWGVTP